YGNSSSFQKPSVFYQAIKIINYNKDSGNTIEMVFVDKEGTRIHASVGEQLIKQFEGKLTEGDAKVV
ncbi:hypothetical protein IGI04_018551, partial [Brassica rapa subsp. trilocularis]